MLFIVSTPIGNMKDISLRALEALSKADIIAAEDTRQARKLLSAYKISYKKLICYNEANEKRKASYLLNALKNNAAVALVSDSGTPLVSDPGYRLAAAAAKSNIKIVPVPGASAFLSALVASGFPTDCFCFYGFLPKRESAKKRLLEKIGLRDETAILYESKYRIKKTLMQIAAIMPDRMLCVARELTKLNESFYYGSAALIAEQLTEKGEFVIVVSKKEKETTKKNKQQQKSQAEEQHEMPDGI